MILIFQLFTFHFYVATSVYGIFYIFQLVRYFGACGSYDDFFDRGILQTRKLLNHGFRVVKLRSSHRKLYDRHNDLVVGNVISVSQMTRNMFRSS
jgi:hypothetical protein